MLCIVYLLYYVNKHQEKKSLHIDQLSCWITVNAPKSRTIRFKDGDLNCHRMGIPSNTAQGLTTLNVCPDTFTRAFLCCFPSNPSR